MGKMKYYIAVEQRCDCNSPCCSKPITGTHPHTNGLLFDELEDAAQWLEDLNEFFEEDYSNYLEENSADIARMEQYEDFMNER